MLIFPLLSSKQSLHFFFKAKLEQNQNMEVELLARPMLNWGIQVQLMVQLKPKVTEYAPVPKYAPEKMKT